MGDILSNCINFFPSQAGSQAGGPIIMDTKPTIINTAVPFLKYQICAQVAGGVLPAGGSLNVLIQPLYSASWHPVATIDLKSLSIAPVFFEAVAQALRFDPVGFDADKTFAVHVVAFWPHP